MCFFIFIENSAKTQVKITLALHGNQAWGATGKNFEHFTRRAVELFRMLLEGVRIMKKLLGMLSVLVLLAGMARAEKIAYLGVAGRTEK